MTAISVDPASAKVPWRIFGIVGGAVIIVGVAFAWNVDAYLYITISSLIPPLIWLGSGARTLPILPIISIQYFVYYALPITRSDAASYDSSALSAVAAMVGAFLGVRGAFLTILLGTLLGSIIGLATVVVLYLSGWQRGLAERAHRRGLGSLNGLRWALAAQYQLPLGTFLGIAAFIVVYALPRLGFEISQSYPSLRP